MVQASDDQRCVPGEQLAEGVSYSSDFLSEAEEKKLLEEASRLTFSPRRTASFSPLNPIEHGEPRPTAARAARRHLWRLWS